MDRSRRGARRVISPLLILLACAVIVPQGAQPAAAGETTTSLQIISVRLYTRGNTVHAVGQVRNTSSEWVYPRINVQFEDACAGTGGLDATTLPVPVAPGGRGTFLGAAARDCAPGTPVLAGTSAFAFIQPASTGAIGIRQHPNQLIAHEDTQLVTARGGVIHNPLPFAVEVMAFGVTFYDAAGVAVSAAWVNSGSTLNPGQQVSAELSGHLRPGIVRAALFVSARRASNPNAPITTHDNYFLDSLDSPFLEDISWLAGQGITGGCGEFRFCPTQPVTRGQMAAFLVRGLSLPPTSTDYFSDDDSSIFENDINRLAASGITGGCSGDRFCPDGTVTRGQMAAFLVRGLSLPPTSTDFFGDDETSIFEGDINRLAASGITGGCARDAYCPANAVIRAHMAAFLHRALD